MMYAVKQCVGVVVAPLMLALFAVGVASLLRLAGRIRPAWWLLVSAAALAYFGAIASVGDALLGPLERQYPPLRDDWTAQGVGHIVVLGSSYRPRDGNPVTAALDEDGLVRVVEGIRLHRRLGIARLIVSGGAPEPSQAPALGYAVLSKSLGVDASSLIVLSDSLDTDDEARAVASLLGDSQFVLVTSAYHMPRAVRLMRRAGARPIPAPTGQRVLQPRGVDLRRWLPSSQGLRKTERALHEYLGLLALSIGLE